MKHFELNWNSSDGLQIFAQAWMPDDRTPKAVVCLIHGLGEHTSRYTHVAEAFCNEGYLLLGADIRGHGRSGGKRGHFSSIEIVLKDIDILLEKSNELYPHLPKVLYGHSMGGVLVLHYCLKHKPDVKAVIATSPGLQSSLEKQPLKVMAAKVLGSIIPGVTISNGLPVKAMSRDQKVIDSLFTDPLYHFKVSLGFGKIMLGVTKWTLQHADEFKYPLLLMHGKADTLAYTSGSIEFAAKLVNKCNLILWDNAYHELHNEPEKKDVLNTMIDWLDTKLNDT